MAQSSASDPGAEETCIAGGHPDIRSALLCKMSSVYLLRSRTGQSSGWRMHTSAMRWKVRASLYVTVTNQNLIWRSNCAASDLRCLCEQPMTVPCRRVPGAVLLGAAGRGGRQAARPGPLPHAAAGAPCLQVSPAHGCSAADLLTSPALSFEIQASSRTLLPASAHCSSLPHARAQHSCACCAMHFRAGMEWVMLTVMSANAEAFALYTTLVRLSSCISLLHPCCMCTAGCCSTAHHVKLLGLAQQQTVACSTTPTA